MDIQDLQYSISTLMADACSIQTLTGEVCETVEVNSSDYFKLHAAYTIAECMDKKLDALGDMLLEIGKQLNQ